MMLYLTISQRSGAWNDSLSAAGQWCAASVLCGGHHPESECYANGRAYCGESYGKGESRP